jgi:hypothetical protein
MTMALRVAVPELLKVTKVGDSVKFTLHLAGMARSVSWAKRVQPWGWFEQAPPSFRRKPESSAFNGLPSRWIQAFAGMTTCSDIP